MNAYIPNDATVLWIWLAALLAVLVVGFTITRIRSAAVARTAAWLLAVSSVAGIERLTSEQPAGFRMLAIIAVLLYAMKAIVGVESVASGKPALRPRNWFAFATLWFGMRPAVFAQIPRAARNLAGDLIWLGVKRLVAGVVLVAFARVIWLMPAEWVPNNGRHVVATVFLLPGLSLILHFGIFNILAGLWRFCGADCRALFCAPMSSRSLTEFWGQRWNLAFSEMATIVVYRPLRSFLGTRWATITAFLFSGLLHELAISVPVKAGFGLPSLYFCLHAVAMSIEHRWQRLGKPIDANLWRGRIWTAAWILIPLPILFHWHFLNGCVWPLIGMESQ